MKSSRQVAETLTATQQQAATTEEADKKRLLHIVLKTDVLGSLEALLGMLEKIQHDLVGVQVIQKGLGNITDTDIERATSVENSVVYGFNVMIPTAMEVLAREKGVECKSYKIIYELFDDVVAKLNALLPQEVIVTELGKAEVAGIFRTEPGKMIIGVRVRDGKLLVNAKVRVWRGDDILGEGVIETLQAGKTATKELSGGQEGGMLFKGKTKLQLGDRLEAYTEESKARKIETFRA